MNNYQFTIEIVHPFFKSIPTALFLLFIVLFSIQIHPQEIEEKQNELTKLKNQISELESEFKSKTQKEKQSYSAFENYNKQNFLLNKIITNLHAEEKEKQQEINQSVDKIRSLESEIKALQDNYAQYIIAIYKNGKISELASLFDARSVEQAILRYKYLQKFSSSREKDLNKLKLNKEQLVAAKAKLEKEKEAKQILAGQKVIEEQQLKAKLNESQSILNRIRNDKASLKKELDAKKNAEIKIKNLITSLIEAAERKRKEEEARLTLLEKERLGKNKTSTTENVIEGKNLPVKDYDIDLSTSAFTSFSNLKGKLNWPITGGKIIKKYGENRNNKLKTVTLNYGVDILASKDMNVKAVAEGVVSAIDWIPGYGSIIIITHKDEYRTVYSHLSEIFVKEGEKVRMGNLLAKVGESLEGNILHFEIWNSRNNQNPEMWLAKK